MTIVMYLGSKVKEYIEGSKKIIDEAIAVGGLRCEKCLRPMKRHSSYVRRIKETGEEIQIAIVWCRKCRKCHALLPDFLLPHKHYSGNEIESVIIDSEDESVSRIDTEASEPTVRRWIKEFEEKITHAVGILKYLFSIGRSGVSEVRVESRSSCYNELEQILEMAPRKVKSSGNKLGLANLWLQTNAIPIFI